MRKPKLINVTLFEWSTAREHIRRLEYDQAHLIIDESYKSLRDLDISLVVGIAALEMELASAENGEESAFMALQLILRYLIQIETVKNMVVNSMKLSSKNRKDQFDNSESEFKCYVQELLKTKFFELKLEDNLLELAEAQARVNEKISELGDRRRPMQEAPECKFDKSNKLNVLRGMTCLGCDRKSEELSKMICVPKPVCGDCAKEFVDGVVERHPINKFEPKSHSPLKCSWCQNSIVRVELSEKGRLLMCDSCIKLCERLLLADAIATTEPTVNDQVDV